MLFALKIAYLRVLPKKVKVPKKALIANNHNLLAIMWACMVSKPTSEQ